MELRVARPRHGSAARGRDPRRPCNGDRIAPTVAGTRASRDAARAGGRRAPVAWRPPALLPARPMPEIPTTTNSWSCFRPLDSWRWAELEEVVSNVSYPDPSDPESGMRAAMAGDLMRSLGRGKPWILMEQTTSRVNWREVNVA